MAQHRDYPASNGGSKVIGPSLSSIANGYGKSSWDKSPEVSVKRLELVDRLLETAKLALQYDTGHEYLRVVDQNGQLHPSLANLVVQFVRTGKPTRASLERVINKYLVEVH